MEDRHTHLTLVIDVAERPVIAVVVHTDRLCESTKKYPCANTQTECRASAAIRSKGSLTMGLFVYIDGQNATGTGHVTVEQWDLVPADNPRVQNGLSS